MVNMNYNVQYMRSHTSNVVGNQNGVFIKRPVVRDLVLKKSGLVSGEPLTAFYVFSFLLRIFLFT
jgi:hypothetical protein